MSNAVTIAVNLVGNNLTGGAFSGVEGAMFALTGHASVLNSTLAKLNGTTGLMVAGALGAGLAFAAFATPVKVGIGGAIELEDKLRMLRQAIQANSDAMPILTQSVNDLGVKTAFSSSEAADAFALLVRSGLTASQVLYGAGASADEYSQHAYDSAKATHGLGFEALALGQALNMSAVDGAELASAAIHTYRGQIMAAKDPTAAASAIINDLAGAFLNGAQSGSDILRFLQQVGPTAASLGVDFRDLVTTGDVLTQSMGNMGMAGTRLRYFLSTLVHPTQAQAREMAALGIHTVDTGAKFDALAAQLIKAGGASADNIEQWRGSVSGLREMFNAAKQVGLVPLDTSFGDWATSTGLLNSKLYDAQGNFLGMKNAINVLHDALKDKTPEERTKALAELFNVRGGDAGRILANMEDFDAKYKQVWERIAKTDVVNMAMERLQTFKGALEQLKDSITSSLSVAFLNILPILTNLANGLSDLLSHFLNAPPAVHTALGVFLLLGAALSGLMFVVLGVGALIGLLGPIAAAVSLPIGGLAAAFFGVPAAILAVSAAIAGLIAWLASGGSSVDWVKDHVASLAGLLSGAGSLAFIVFGGHAAQVAGFVSLLLGPLTGLGGAFRAILPFIQDVGLRFLVLQQNIGPLLAAALSRLGSLFSGIGPVIARVAGFLLNLYAQAYVAYGALGGMQGVVAALWSALTSAASAAASFLAPIAAIVGVALLVAAAVAGVIIQFREWWNTSSQFRAIVMDLWSRLQQLGSLLMGQLQQGLNSVRSAMGNMQPTLDALKSAWTALQPILQIIGGVIIVALIAALGLLIAVLTGVISAIGPLISAIVGGLAGALQMVAGLFQFLAGVVQTVIGIIRGLFTGDWSGMLAGLNTMKAGALNVWNGLVSSIVAIVGGLAGAVGGLIGGFVGAIVSWFRSLADILVGHSIVPDMIVAIVSWFARLPGMVLGGLGGFVGSVVGKFFEMAGRGAQVVGQMAGQVASNFGNMASQALGRVSAMAGSIGGAISSMAGNVAGRAASMAGQFIGQIGSMAGQAVSRVQSMGGQIVGAISGVAGQLAGAGRNMIQGLIGGIQSMAGAAVNAARGVATSAINAAKGALGINSPSKVFHDIGLGTVEGFVNGLTGGQGQVQDSVNQTFGTLTPSSSLNVGSLSSVLAAQAQASASSGSSRSRSDLQPIHIHIGNEQLASYVFDHATGTLKQAGVGRMGR